MVPCTISLIKLVLNCPEDLKRMLQEKDIKETCYRDVGNCCWLWDVRTDLLQLDSVEGKDKERNPMHCYWWVLRGVHWKFGCKRVGGTTRLFRQPGNEFVPVMRWCQELTLAVCWLESEGQHEGERWLISKRGLWECVRCQIGERKGGCREQLRVLREGEGRLFCAMPLFSLNVINSALKVQLISN